MEITTTTKSAIVITKADATYAVIEGKHYKLEELHNGDFDELYETNRARHDKIDA